MKRIYSKVVISTLGVLCLVWLGDVHLAKAQWQKKWLAVGSLHTEYQEGGGLPEQAPNGMAWPGWYPYRDANRSKALWVAVENHRDAEGRVWPARIAHIGPRVKGQGEMFPTEFSLISRFEKPVVTVDGLQTFKRAVFYDETDPSQAPAAVIHNVFNTIVGITVERKIMQFSNNFHDNYHIVEYTVTNTGNVDADPEQELQGQTAEGVYLFGLHRYAVNQEAAGIVGGGASWGQNAMVDAVGDGMEDYDPDFRAQYAWHGYSTSFGRWNNIGAPALEDGPSTIPEGDTLGRLTAAEFIGRVTIHADESAESTSDDPGQPATMGWYNTNRAVMSSGQNAFDEEQMRQEYLEVTRGRVYPHHADLVTSEGPWDPEKMANQTNNPGRGESGGYGFREGYGPYTLEPGESVKIVVAEAAAGLSREATREIGRKWKQAYLNGNPDQEISYDADGDGSISADESMSKNLWVMTSRDSLFQTFRRAIANYNSGYSIPKAPLPPREFTVTGGTNRITLDWTLYEGAEDELTGFEIYRTSGRMDRPYEKVATLEATERQFEDTEVIRGLQYYYYIQAVGQENTDDTGLTPTGVRLRSNRTFTQTYDPAILKRSPGEEVADTRIVPNPYHLGSDQGVRWPDQQDRIGFLEVPGQCTIRIYTEMGELVETIEHTDGSGDEYWDLTTSSNQVVVSGIYHAVIVDHETGEELIRNFVIIR